MMAISVQGVAKVAYEANRAYCETNGDFSNPPWDEAEQWQKDTLIVGVNEIIQNPDRTPEQSHKSWLLHKLAYGWKYGSVKDVEKKEHPCMVEYEELPVDQRVKDTLFTSIVKALLPMMLVLAFSLLQACASSNKAWNFEGENVEANLSYGPFGGKLSADWVSVKSVPVKTTKEGEQVYQIEPEFYLSNNPSIVGEQGK